MRQEREDMVRSEGDSPPSHFGRKSGPLPPVDASVCMLLRWPSFTHVCTADRFERRVCSSTDRRRRFI